MNLEQRRRAEQQVQRVFRHRRLDYAPGARNGQAHLSVRTCLPVDQDRAWLEVGGGLFNVSTHDETWPHADSGATSGVVMKVYVADGRPTLWDARRLRGLTLSPNRKTDSGEAGPTGRWILRSIDGRFRCVAAISPLSGGDCLLG